MEKQRNKNLEKSSKDLLAVLKRKSSELDSNDPKKAAIDEKIKALEGKKDVLK